MADNGILATYEQIKSLIEASEHDVVKAAGGTNAAGTRVRKQMQELKALSQTMRQQILDARNAD